VPTGTQDWIERYLHHLQTERRLSGNTRLHYRRDLMELLAFCEKAGIPDWRDLDTHQVRQFAAQAHRRGLSGHSIQRRLSAIRGFYNYLLREQVVTGNPAHDVSAPKSPQRLPDTLSVDDISNLLAVETDDPLEVRDLAML
jgi:integrase/recombinase XerC